MLGTSPARRRATYGTLVVALSLTGCSSDGASDPIDAADDAPSALDRRADALAVALSSPPAEDTYEIWSCLTDALEPIGYTFFRDGTFDGAASSLRLGKELDPGIASASEQLRYVWTTFSESSLRLEAPDRGMQIDWTDIAISEDGVMSAFSSNRGALWCRRNTVDKSAVEPGR